MPVRCEVSVENMEGNMISGEIGWNMEYGMSKEDKKRV